MTIDKKIEIKIREFFVNWEKGYSSAYDAIDLLKEIINNNSKEKENNNETLQG